MRVAVVGSRDFRDLELVREVVRALPAGTTVVSGGARGVDRTAEEAAREVGLAVRVIRPEWKRADGTFDRTAGFARNSLIIEDADRVIAFWDGRSPGTKDTIRKAQDAGKHVEMLVHRASS